MTGVAVIIPARDEEATIATVVAALPPGVRALVVDNGSTDATAARAARAGATVLTVPEPGYGRAVRAALATLAADPPDVVVVLDADLSDDPRWLPELLAPLQDGRADVALSQRVSLGSPESLTPQQRLGNALATRWIRWRTGFRYRDLGPFRAMTWSAARALDLQDETWGINVEGQLGAALLGLRVVEVPLPYHPRRAGHSKISGTVIGTVRAGYRILATLARLPAPPARPRDALPSPHGTATAARPAPRSPEPQDPR